MMEKAGVVSMDPGVFLTSKQVLALFHCDAVSSSPQDLKGLSEYLLNKQTHIRQTHKGISLLLRLLGRGNATVTGGTVLRKVLSAH